MSANTTVDAGLPSEVAKLQKEARILDLCDLAKRTTEKLAAAEVEIGETKKKLDNFVEARECFNKKAAHAAKVLAGCGAIEKYQPTSKRRISPRPHSAELPNPSPPEASMIRGLDWSLAGAKDQMDTWTDARVSPKTRPKPKRKVKENGMVQPR